MPKIHSLSDEIVAQIAAGEVIERPAYAVKELVENSLDAGSTVIKIELEDAGLKRIEVIDNGDGMDEADLLNCFKLHTTSKISETDHLGSITTLGFRGEALSSIAAISHLTISSRTVESPSGLTISIENGEVVKKEPVGMPVGTIVKVEHLFGNVPARKKFLKSSATELRHIIDLVSQISLGYPTVRFTLIHNKRTIFDLLPVEDVVERVKFLLGESVFQTLLPLSYDESYLKVKGFLAHPHTLSQSLSKQFSFINQRRVTDKLLSAAVKESLVNLIDPKQQPVFVLFLQTPPEILDVNIHPRKEVVKFVSPQMIHDLVQKAVYETLVKHNLTSTALVFRDRLTESYAGELLKETADLFTLQSFEPNTEEIFQLQNLYLVVPTKNGLGLIDQHAAHERIIYEELQKQYKNEKIKNKKHSFEESIVINLSVLESQVLQDNLETLEQLGFEVEEFGKNKFKVVAVPDLMRDRDITQLIREMVLDLSDSDRPKAVDSQTDQMLKFLACRAAVMAGDPLTQKQAQELVKKLNQTDNNQTCPHGRPTRIELTMSQINKNFKRI